MNFELCVEALRDAGFEAEAGQFEALLDEDTWVEYALEQIRMVREVAEELGGLTIHTWPDRNLLRATSGELRARLVRMKQHMSEEAW